MHRDLEDRNLNKKAVVLSSGGADGAYAVGVLKALFEGACPATEGRPFAPEVLSGGSIGAFNAAFIATHCADGWMQSLQDLEKVWLEDLADENAWQPKNTYRIRANPFQILLDPVAFVKDPLEPIKNAAEDSVALARMFFERMVSFTRVNVPLGHRVVDLLDLEAFLTTDPLVAIINKRIPFDRLTDAVRLSIVTTDWDNGHLKHFSNRDLTKSKGRKILSASIALPGLLSPVEIDGIRYADAAVLGYAALHPAIAAGADELHVICLDLKVAQMPIGEFEGTVDAFYHTMVASWLARIDDRLEFTHLINEAIGRVHECVRHGGLDQTEGRFLLKGLIPSGRFDDIDSNRVPHQVTVHVHHPKEETGGIHGLFDFTRDRLRGLIDLGYREAIEHDCKENGCVIPGLQRFD